MDEEKETTQVTNNDPTTGADIDVSLEDEDGTFSENPKEVFGLVTDTKDAEPEPEPEQEPENADNQSEEVTEEDNEGAAQQAPEEETEPEEEEDESGQQNPSPLDNVALTLDGKKYTGRQVIEMMENDPQTAVRILTRAEQAPHWQGLYNQMLENIQAQGVPAAQTQAGNGAPAQAGAEDPVGSVVQVLEAYRPRAQQLVDAIKSRVPDHPAVEGLESALELQPGVVEGLVFLADQLAELQGVLGTIMPVVQEQGVQRFNELRQQRLNEMIDKASADVPELKDQGVREQLGQALANDPVLASMDPRALWSQEAEPFVDRIIRGLLWQVDRSGAKDSSANSPKPKQKARKASGPPSTAMARGNVNTSSILERLFTGE